MSDANLLAELEAASEGYNHATGGCKICWYLEQMPDDVREAVEIALTGTMGERTLAEILTRNGYPIGKHSVSKHRKGHTP